MTWILPLVQVVVHGTSEATNHLVDFARKVLNVSEDKVVAPHIGEPINGTTESHIYQVGGLLRNDSMDIALLKNGVGF